MSGPMNIQQAMDSALRHHNAGRLQEAEQVYRQVLEAHPNHADAIHLLGLIALQAGQPDAALDLIHRAIALNPKSPQFYCNLGYALNSAGRVREAITAYRKALELRPQFPEACNNLGNALRDIGEFDEAIAVIRRGLSVRPDDPQALNSLGSALRAKGQTDDAIAVFEKALQIRPDYVEAHNNLGNALREIERHDEAMIHFQRALALRPGFSQVINNIAGGLEEQGKFQESMAMYRQALAADPQVQTAHVNLGIALLRQGNLSEGWTEYAWRRAEGAFDQPVWDGSPLDGKRLLLHAEQGLGDSIQFVRYLPLVAERGGKIILQCQTQLKRLFQAIHGIDTLITDLDPIPEFDLHCPLLSLPSVFKTMLETIPAKVPYLRADPELSAQWRKRFNEGDRRTRIGLVWAGRREYANDRRRSLDPRELAPLIDGIDAHFISLQKGSAAQLPLTDWTDDLNDFADTAALVENLDLVISVDTAVAHLAGAMGKKVWTLLPFVPDWRWLLDRSDSPWYPTMRLFRQPRSGDWQAVVSQLIAELQCPK